MDGNLKNLIKAAKTINLSVEEKDELRYSVLNFISQNPAASKTSPGFEYKTNILFRHISFVHRN